MIVSEIDLLNENEMGNENISSKENYSHMAKWYLH